MDIYIIIIKNVIIILRVKRKPKQNWFYRPSELKATVEFSGGNAIFLIRFQYKFKPNDRYSLE